MTDSLSSDELGETGEALFRKLCAQAKLFCSKSDRDRTGWDFRVELPMETNTTARLDDRSARSCFIQLKCTANDSRGQVKARLSAVERLAKEPGPSAAIVFTLGRDGTEQDGFLIHLIGDELARVLRRLRLEDSRGRRDVNKREIAFRYHGAIRFDPSPSGLKTALEALCPSDMGGYVDAKREQLARLGYVEGGEVLGQAIFRVESVDHLTRVLCGLTPLSPLRIEAQDMRFGIPMPYRGPLFDGAKEIHFQLPPVGPCDIVVRNGPLAPAALFHCEAFAPPPIEGGPLMVIRHPLITVLFKPDRLEFQTVDIIGGGRHGLDDWLLLLRALVHLSSGHGTIGLTFGGHFAPPLKVAPDALTGPDSEDLPKILSFLEGWKRGLGQAGLPEPQPFTLDDVSAVCAAQMTVDMIFNPAPIARLEVGLIEGADDLQSVTVLYFNTVGFAATSFSFALRVTLERGPNNVFASTAFDLLDIRPPVPDIDPYGAAIAEQHGETILMHPGNITIGEAYGVAIRNNAT